MVSTAARWAETNRVEIVVDANTSELLKTRVNHRVLPLAQIARKSDLILVFGGDGTLLNIARQIGRTTPPILGVNAGHLGFLTATQGADLKDSLDKLETAFEKTRLPLLRAGGESKEMVAVNDFVISRTGPQQRVIDLEVRVNQKLLTVYRGDGLIVSTPTGSTAYSLAAGGPIISPHTGIVCLTPICAHSLSNRSVIVNLSATIQVKVLTNDIPTILSADGQEQMSVSAGETITINKSKRCITLLKRKSNSFFETLQEKMNWSGSPL